MRLVLLSLLLLPSFAHAGPVFASIGTFFGASATTAVAVGMAVVQIGLTVAMSIYGAAKQRKAARRQRDAYNAGLQDRTVTRVATESPYVYVYGRARVGSAIVAMLSSGSREEYKHLVCIHAAHECDGFEDIYINGKPLGALDADGFPISSAFNKTMTGHAREAKTGGTFTLAHTPSSAVSVYTSGSSSLNGEGGNEPVGFLISGKTVTTDSAYDGQPLSVVYQYTDNVASVRVKKHLGTADDPADASLIAEVPSKWTSNHVLRGFCYTVIRLDLNEPEFQGGPPTVEALLRGAKVLDVRSGVTAWSQNAALIVNHYLTSEMCGVDDEDIPLASLIAAANVCDETISSGGARYTINGTVTSDESQSGVLGKMAQAMAGGIVSTTWDMWAGKYTAPVMALEQSDIVGKIAITPGISDADLYNGVRGQFVDSENGYVATDFKPYQNSSYVTADGEEKWTNIDYPFTDKLQRVHNLSRIETEDQRNGYTVIPDFSLKAWKLKVGDRVTLTSSFFGWDAKVFRVTDKKFSPTSPVQLSLKEDAAEIWDEADAVTVDVTPNTNLPNPFAIDPLESLICESGTDALLVAQDGTIISRILVTWPAATLTDGQIEIQWQRIGSDVWQQAFARADETQAYLSPVKDGVPYVVRARCIKTYLSNKSDWVYADVHTVIGKTEPPSTVADVALTQELVFFAEVADIDLRGYEVRAVPGANAQWSLGVPVHDGYITDSPYRFARRLQSVQTVMVAAIDTSGNYGLPGYATLDFGVIDEFNVAQTHDFKELGWQGEVTNASVVSDNLVADLDPEADFWTIGRTSFWVRDNISDFWGGETYLSMDYIGVYVPQYSDGDIILDTTILGSRVEIKWRVDGGEIGDFWMQGSPDFWSGYPAIWGAVGSWKPYVGAIKSKKDRGIQFWVHVDAGPQRGQITQMAARLQMPDKEQVFTNIAISAGGTRLDPALGVPPVTWIEVEEADFTIYADGSGAIVGRVTDFDPALGPEVETLNVSGVAVNSTGQTVRLRGF